MNLRSNLPLRGIFGLLMAVLTVVSARNATRSQRLHAYLILGVGLAVSGGWAGAWYLIAQPVTEFVGARTSVPATRPPSGVNIPTAPVTESITTMVNASLALPCTLAGYRCSARSNLEVCEFTDGRFLRRQVTDSAHLLRIEASTWLRCVCAWPQAEPALLRSPSTRQCRHSRCDRRSPAMQRASLRQDMPLGTFEEIPLHWPDPDASA